MLDATSPPPEPSETAHAPAAGLAGRWFITSHARERYRARWAPDASPDQALARLTALSERARFVRAWPDDGRELWRGPKPQSIRLVVDPAPPEGGMPALVTVLPPYGQTDDAPEGVKPEGPHLFDDWQDVPGHPGKRTHLGCRICRTPLLRTTGPETATCGKAACRSEYNVEQRAWAWRCDPRRKEVVRRATADYQARQRKTTPTPTPTAPTPDAAPTDPWALPSPAYGSHLPGAWRELRFTPAPHTPIPLAHASPLHGIVSHALGQDHSPARADFVLVPGATPSGWGVYLTDAALAPRLSAAPRAMRLYERQMGVDFGPLVVRPKAPASVPPGRHAVRLTTLTPVVIRRTVDGKTLVRVAPTAASLRATLTSHSFLARLGLAEAPPVAVLLVRHETRRASVEVAGHWRSGDDEGRVHGWEGDVWLEVSAPALWLLRCAEVVGLGGRVALGFGRVRVTEESAPC